MNPEPPKPKGTATSQPGTTVPSLGLDQPRSNVLTTVSPFELHWRKTERHFGDQGLQAMKRIAKKIAGSYEPKNYYLRDLLLSLYNGKSVSLSEVGGLDLNLRVDLSTVIHCFGRGGFDRRKVRDILVAAASSDPAWLLSGPQISYALGDSQTFEHDLQLVNGDRVHGRLTMNDVEAALDRFGYEEVVVVGGTPEGSNPRQVVTVAILIQERGWAVGEVTAMTVAGFQQATTMQMQHVDAYYPKLIAHLGELLRDIYQP